MTLSSVNCQLLAFPRLWLGRERTADGLGLAVQLSDDLLGLELLALLAGHEGERVSLLVGLAPVDPCASVDLLDLGNELAERSNDVAQDRQVGLDDLVDVLRLDLEVDDTTGAVERGSAGSGSKG